MRARDESLLLIMTSCRRIITRNAYVLYETEPLLVEILTKPDSLAESGLAQKILVEGSHAQVRKLARPPPAAPRQAVL